LHIQAAANLHCKTREAILNREIERGKKIQGLRLLVGIARESGHHMSEGLQTFTATVVLELHAAEAAPKALVVRQRLIDARRRDVIEVGCLLPMAGDVAGNADVAPDICGDGRVKAVEV